MESLGRLQQELQGETPAAALLWNEAIKGGGKVYMPKDENALSDYVKLHLDRDLKRRGIIANREVELRRGRGSAGERTDIHVDAVLRIPEARQHDTVTAIIEAKGCWHREVLEAMETQLVNRYLRDNQCRHGLYLVGWYVCPQWDSEDRRRRDTPRLTLDQARECFAAQAADLSQRASPNAQVTSFVLNAALREPVAQLARPTSGEQRAPRPSRCAGKK